MTRNVRVYMRYWGGRELAWKVYILVGKGKGYNQFIFPISVYSWILYTNCDSGIWVLDSKNRYTRSLVGRNILVSDNSYLFYCWSLQSLEKVVYDHNQPSSLSKNLDQATFPRWLEDIDQESFVYNHASVPDQWRPVPASCPDTPTPHHLVSSCSWTSTK